MTGQAELSGLGKAPAGERCWGRRNHQDWKKRQPESVVGAGGIIKIKKSASQREQLGQTELSGLEKAPAGECRQGRRNYFE